MYVDWEYYKIFYYVAKYQNFTKAARVLGNNQPNITPVWHESTPFLVTQSLLLSRLTGADIT